MKRNLMLAWVCVLGSLAGLALLFSVNQKQAAELAKLHADDQRRSQMADAHGRPQANEGDLARTRQEREELLRLRNQVHQLALEKAELSRKLSTAEARAQQAQARAEEMESQVASLRSSATAAPPVPLSAEARAKFMNRYGLVPARPEDAAALECLNNLRQIEGAKQQWALEHNQGHGAAVTEADILPYLKGGAIPKCPSGGTYTLNPVGSNPVCSVPGHALPN